MDLPAFDESLPRDLVSVKDEDVSSYQKTLRSTKEQDRRSMKDEASTSSMSPEPVEEGSSGSTNTSIVENDEIVIDTQNSDTVRGDILWQLASQVPRSSQPLEESDSEEYSPTASPSAARMKANGSTTTVDRPTDTVADSARQTSTRSTFHVNVPNFEGNPQTVKLTPAEKPSLPGSKVPSRMNSASTGNVGASSSEQGETPSVSGGFKVLYSSNSSVSDSPRIKSELARRHQVVEVKKVADCDFFCVAVDKKLKKTANLILAVAMGKPVVSDVWARKSAQEEILLDPMNYLAKDPESEALWGIDLEEASKRGEKHLTLLKNKKILVSPKAWIELGSGIKDLQEIARYAGAASIEFRSPSASDNTLQTIVITSDNDPDFSYYHGDLGWRCFSKDIITTGVLRGKVDTSSDEFLITDPSSQGSQGKKRKRSS